MSKINFFILLPMIMVNCLAASPIKIDYYYQPGCPECRKIEALILPRLQAEYPGTTYQLNRYDTGNKENFLRLLSAMEQLKITSNDNVAMVIDNTSYLGGYKQIEQRLFAIMKERPATTEPAAATAPPDDKVLNRQAGAITLGLVILAGLEDGINPCVFATLVFMLSLLAIAGISGKKLLEVGGAYCAGVFVCYLALGFGLFKAIRALGTFPTMQTSLEILIVAALIVMAGISFADAWNYFRRHEPAAVQLRLPEKLKHIVNAILRRSLNGNHPLPGAFIAGMLVTLLEAVCTGQVYLPTLVMLSKESGAGWWGYLLLYNLMFIVPLVALLLCYYYGIGIKKLLQWSKNNVIPAKIMLGCFFLLLAAILLGMGRGGA